MDEGSLLEVEEHAEGILLKKAVPLKAGEIVGEKAYHEIISELDELRRKKWR